MSELDFAIQFYCDLKAEIDEHQEKEPIGLQYTKANKYHWSWTFHQLQSEFNVAKHTLNTLLDKQLDEYMEQAINPNITTWNKSEACRLLKERLGLYFSASIKDLFLYVGRSVMCIPVHFKDKVINEFAYALEEWDSIDIDVLREAVKNIGSKIEERCYHCNELMPEFEGTGHAICSDCL